MPLPLGHTAFGLLIHEVTAPQPAAASKATTDSGPSWVLRLKWFFIITVLANLPDADVIVGLLVDGNGSLFHRGPSHSLVFALLAGGLVSRLSYHWRVLPRIQFRTAFALILSHVVADALFTTSPVSFLWPLEVHWTTGHSGWREVLNAVLFEGFRDLGLVVASALLVILIRMLRASGGHRNRAALLSRIRVRS